jgi:hypothetical protein
VKTLTLTQPWATLVAIGRKTFETRSWSTNYRGPLAIHAGKGTAEFTPRELRELCNREPFKSVLAEAGYEGRALQTWDLLPRGAIIAVCDLVDCIPTDSQGKRAHWYETPRLSVGEPERSFGNFGPNRFAWKLANVRRLREPLPARGALGLWDHEWAPIEALLEG